ncbi:MULTISPECIES: class I SAM-dependent DNA methyltransferase [unclassified Streptomyces]|uniref:class I SAM-dependent DNA methyltransferase n=1 Tax=unclassified Streptomyces TaxID=2593676 RepID=UPI0022B6F010|nr:MULTISPECIES: class I SAM-dependent methyltransferase [unclassified Streptomyces]MCZ7413703.1 class I SAM-dependent methyltransferase [Streptomyces sp. WMMC897]MCZ7430700.1 class I SAM-dependent methyltransferase [Streptomyces sp. WMMC1477]
MTELDDPAFFDRYAHAYDLRDAYEPTPAVDFLAELAPAGGRAPELAIGTGRVALPPAARGISVEGIDGSPAMVERLRAKPGGPDIPVTIGDMAEVAVDGPFAFSYLVFNTLFNLPDQARQVDCFHNVARVLEPGGVFVVECFVQDVTEFDRHQQVATRALSETEVNMEFLLHDPVGQTVTYQRVTFDAEGTTLRPLRLRYCWPSELDLMARLAGMRLRERYTDWDRSPFTATSRRHVSVYEKP